MDYTAKNFLSIGAFSSMSIDIIFYMKKMNTYINNIYSRIRTKYCGCITSEGSVYGENIDPTYSLRTRKLYEAIFNKLTKTSNSDEGWYNKFEISFVRYDPSFYKFVTEFKHDNTYYLSFDHAYDLLLSIIIKIYHK